MKNSELANKTRVSPLTNYTQTQTKRKGDQAEFSAVLCAVLTRNRLLILLICEVNLIVSLLLLFLFYPAPFASPEISECDFLIVITNLTPLATSFRDLQPIFSPQCVQFSSS